MSAGEDPDDDPARTHQQYKINIGLNGTYLINSLPSFLSTIFSSELFNLIYPLCSGKAKEKRDINAKKKQVKLKSGKMKAK